MNSCGLEFFYVWKISKRSLMPYIISQLKNQKPKLLSPNSSNDFIHVDDVCRALILAIKKKKYPVYSMLDLGNKF